MNPKNQRIDFKNGVFDYTTGMEQFLVGQVKQKRLGKQIKGTNMVGQLEHESHLVRQVE